LILSLSLILLFAGCNSDKKANKSIEASNQQENVDEKKETDLNNANSIQSTEISPNEQVGKDNNNVSQTITKVNSKVKLHEGTYLDDRYLGHNIAKLKNYCEVVISNVTNISFDFIVYEVDMETEDKKVIFLKNTAVFTGDGMTAAFYGNNYTLNFTFPNITDVKISGFKPLEGKTYVNNGIPGLKLYEGTYWDERCLGDNILKLKSYCEVVISNVTNTSFDFTVYEIDRETENKKVIFLKNTAVFTDDGTKSTFYGNDHTLNFTFPSLTEIKISGFKPLEGKTYLNNKIPGHECS